MPGTPREPRHLHRHQDAFGAGGRLQAAIFVNTGSGGLLLDCAPDHEHGTQRTRHPAQRGRWDRRLALPPDSPSPAPQLHMASIYRIAATTRSSSRARRASRRASSPAADAIGHGLTRSRDALSRCVSSSCGRTTRGHRPGERLLVRREPPTRGRARTAWISRWAEGGSVYSGDTGWFDDLPRHTPRRSPGLRLPPSTSRPFSEQSRTARLIERAPSLGCERLILTHLGPMR